MEFNDFISSVSNKWGYQNSPDYRSYSNRAKMVSKLMISGDWDKLGKNL